MEKKWKSLCKVSEKNQEYSEKTQKMNIVKRMSTFDKVYDCRFRACTCLLYTSSALDVAVQRQVVQEMLHVRELFGTAIIIVTHDIGVVSAMADTVLVLQNGNRMEYGLSLIHIFPDAEVPAAV